jgi:hypothetical protein
MAGYIQTHLKSAATHLEVLGFKCQGVKPGKGSREYYIFAYSPECQSALLNFERAFKAIQSLEYVTPASPGQSRKGE